jgi:hypothetical protein
VELLLFRSTVIPLFSLPFYCPGDKDPLNMVLIIVTNILRYALNFGQSQMREINVILNATYSKSAALMWNSQGSRKRGMPRNSWR